MKRERTSLSISKYCDYLLKIMSKVSHTNKIVVLQDALIEYMKRKNIEFEDHITFYQKKDKQGNESRKEDKQSNEEKTN